MNDEKIRRAERLFDAIGGIDDRIIAEAAEPYVARRARFGFGRIATVAASLLVCVGILAGAVSLLGRGFVTENEKSEDMAEAVPGVSTSLSDTLCAHRGSSSILKVSSSNIDLFSGRMSVIWKYSGESDYSVVYVPERKAAELSRELEKSESAARLTREESESVECLVWICDGNGSVVSPYLESSDGNVGYGVLFDYSPEIEPTERVNDLIGDLIS